MRLWKGISYCARRLAHWKSLLSMKTTGQARMERRLRSTGPRGRDYGAAV